jgi:ferrous iron transport protein A
METQSKEKTDMTLGEAKVGVTVVVQKIEGDGAYKRRIMDMGITKGTELYIRKVAPLGDPVEITVRGYELSVRKNDAQCVQVKQEQI